MDTEKADDAEVAEHAVQRSRAVVASYEAGIGVLFHGGELGSYFRALDEGVEDIEDRVAAPCVRIIAEEGEVIVAGGILRGVGIAGNAVTVAAKGFELINEFVDDIPGPEWLLYVSKLEMKITAGTSSRRVVRDPQGLQNSGCSGISCSNCHNWRTWSPELPGTPTVSQQRRAVLACPGTGLHFRHMSLPHPPDLRQSGLVPCSH